MGRQSPRTAHDYFAETLSQMAYNKDVPSAALIPNGRGSFRPGVAFQLAPRAAIYIENHLIRQTHHFLAPRIFLRYSTTIFDFGGC